MLLKCLVVWICRLYIYIFLFFDGSLLTLCCKILQITIGIWNNTDQNLYTNEFLYSVRNSIMPHIKFTKQNAALFGILIRVSVIIKEGDQGS
jgi:hypothetical protein